MAEEEARFALKVDADAEPAAEAAKALESFRSTIEKSQAAIGSYRKSMSLLRGSSDEVADAKAKLRAAIAAEQAVVTKANLGIMKLNGSYEKLAKAHKKEKDASEATKKAVGAIGGPVKLLGDKFATLKEVLGGASTGWGVLAVALTAGIAVLALGTAAVADLVLKLTTLTVTSGDSLRNLRLMREAVSGNTENANAWGHQIDFLALKLATSKDQLNELVIGLEKSLRGTRVSGQGMVDVFKAVATAGAAMGPDVGKSLEEILTRGKMTGRFWVGFKGWGISELQGLGITFQQVAEQVGKNLHIGTQAAKIALMRGAVTMDQGAKAVRQVVEGRFASINEKKMLSLDALWTKFKDNVRDFASDAAKEGGALEPLLKGLKAVVDMFGLQSESGQRTKRVVTEYTQALADAFTRNLPLIKSVVSAGLDLVGTFVRATAAVIAFAQSSTGAAIIKAVLVGLAVVAGVVVVAFGLAVAAVGAAVVGIGLALKNLWDTVRTVFGALSKIGQVVSDAIVDGLIGGLRRRFEDLKGSVSDMVSGIKKTFTMGLLIHSPSRVFYDYGGDIGEGAQQGVRASQPRVEDASASLARGAASAASAVVSAPAAPPPAAPAAEASAGGTRASGPEVRIIFNITGQEPQKTATMLQSQSLLDGLTQAVRAALKGGGIPTGSPVASGG